MDHAFGLLQSFASLIDFKFNGNRKFNFDQLGDENRIE